LSGEWDHYAQQWLDREPQQLWRSHSDVINGGLLDRWLPARRVRTILKTDVFDEGVADGLHHILASRADTVVGIDVSSRILAAASRRHSGLRCLGADVRALPLATGSIDAIVSLSTLDHFEDVAGLEESLSELSRVLVRGGTMIVTLDNLSNPLIAVRNALPFSVTHAVGLVPYPVGKSQSPSRLVRLVEEAGFDVSECTAIMHAPRLLAIPALNMLDRIIPRRISTGVTASLRGFELLRSAPTRFLTGHFIAVRAIKA
jgi:SAM-dependent methyltransferase